MGRIQRKYIADNAIDNTKIDSAAITGQTAETSADDNDLILIYDDTAGALRKMTRANFTSGLGGGGGSTGDISETSFSIANNQSSAANVTSFAFANGTVRGFKAIASIEIDATADLFEMVEIMGIQKGSDWDISISRNGDDSGIEFSITTAGQIQYTSNNYAGFVSGKIKFRSDTTTVG